MGFRRRGAEPADEPDSMPLYYDNVIDPPELPPLIHIWKIAKSTPDSSGRVREYAETQPIRRNGNLGPGDLALFALIAACGPAAQPGQGAFPPGRAHQNLRLYQPSLTKWMKS